MKFFLAAVTFISLVLGCSGDKKYPKAENAFDAGREFIDGCLKGDFDKAAFYMLKDADNKAHLSKLQADYKLKSKNDKQQYHDASINILDDEEVDDHTHIINYKNSYDHIARKVKVVLQGSNWLVDFKYTFNGNL